MNKGTTIVLSLHRERNGAPRQWWQWVHEETGLPWARKSTWTSSFWPEQSAWCFWTNTCGLTAMGEDIKPLFTVNAMQGELSQCYVGCPPPSVPCWVMWPHVRLRTHLLFQVTSGVWLTSYLTEMVELGNGFCKGWERKCHVPVENLGQNSISETCEDKKQYFPGCPGPAETSGYQSLTGCVACIWDPSYSHHWAWEIVGTELWAAVHGDSQMSIQCLASLRRFQSHPPD